MSLSVRLIIQNLKVFSTQYRGLLKLGIDRESRPIPGFAGIFAFCRDPGITGIVQINRDFAGIIKFLIGLYISSRTVKN